MTRSRKQLKIKKKSISRMAFNASKIKTKKLAYTPILIWSNATGLIKHMPDMMVCVIMIPISGKEPPRYLVVVKEKIGPRQGM